MLHCNIIHRAAASGGRGETLLQYIQAALEFLFLDGERRRQGDDPAHGNLEAQAAGQASVHERFGKRRHIRAVRGRQLHAQQQTDAAHVADAGVAGGDFPQARECPLTERAGALLLLR